MTEAAEISDPVVGLVSEPPFPKGRELLAKLSHLDYRVLGALQRDSRRLITDVAEAVGVSAMTAARHLERIVREGLVEFSAEWYPDASNDIISAFHLDLAPGTDKGQVMATLFNAFAPNLLFVWSFSNLPRRLMSMAWTGTVKELRDLQLRIRGMKLIRGVMTNVLDTGWIFEMWRDALLTERARAAVGQS